MEAVKKVYEDSLDNDWIRTCHQIEMDLIEKKVLEEEETTQSGFEWTYEEAKLKSLLEHGDCVITVDGSNQFSGEKDNYQSSTDYTSFDYLAESCFENCLLSLLKNNGFHLEHPRLQYSGLLRVN